MSLRIPYDTIKETVKKAFLNVGLSEEQAEDCATIHTPVSYTHLRLSAPTILTRFSGTRIRSRGFTHSSFPDRPGGNPVP